MNTRKAFTFMIAFVVALVLFFEVSAHADEGDQATQLTFSQPVQIPGQVLPAGTYWFLLSNISEQKDVVQIFNSDRSRLYATLITASTERQEPTGHTVVKLAEEESPKPAAVMSWFYQEKRPATNSCIQRTRKSNLLRTVNRRWWPRRPPTTLAPASNDGRPATGGGNLHHRLQPGVSDSS